MTTVEIITIVSQSLSALTMLAVIFGAIYKYVTRDKMENNNQDQPQVEIVITANERSIQIRNDHHIGMSKFNASEENIDLLIQQLQIAKNTLKTLTS